jgi:hypothetical protein
MISFILSMVVCGLLLASPVHAGIKVQVVVSPVSFDGTTIVIKITVNPGDGAPLTTNRNIVAANISDPATAITSIKNLVITFMLNQYAQTVVASEILVWGAPQ